MRNALGVTYNQQFSSYLTVGANEEAIDQPLYHIQSYPAAGSLNFTFFGATNASGYAVTNLTNQNQLPMGNRFLARSISIVFIPGSKIQEVGAAKVFGTTATSYLNDVQAALESPAYFTVTLTNKPYVYAAPLTYYPQGFGLSAESSSAQLQLATAADSIITSGHANNGLPTKGAMHMLGVPLVLPALTNFNAQIVYPSLAALPSGVAGYIGVIFNGLLIRPTHSGLSDLNS